MTYPRIEISLEKLKKNTEILVGKCQKYNIEIAAVTKVFCGNPQIARCIVDGGVTALADSRLENLERMKEINVTKWLLRLPMISQVEKVVDLVDISLNSEIETIRAISNKAIEKGKKHKIILMIDLGDLREGIFKEKEIFKTIEEIMELKGVGLIGLGSNLTCYGGIIPQKENLGRLLELKEKIETMHDMELKIISGGNSSSLHLVESGEIPKGINQLRLGESIVLGRETAFGELIEGTYDNAFKLVAEIIEIKDKPSIPIGEIGMDAFGNKPTFTNKGIRTRAICAIGKQDVDKEDIIPEDTEISILGSSSDHLILDVTDCNHKYKVGDKVSFKLTYGGILSTMTSEYVTKISIK